MTAWRVRWDPRTKKELARLGRAAAERVGGAVLSKLAPDPYSGTRLAGSSRVPLWRFRIGDYRVLYTIEPQEVLILVVRVGHRSTVYRDLEKVANRAADP